MVTSDQNLCHWVFCVFPPLLPRTFLQNRRRQSKCAAKRKLLEWKCNENIWKSGEMLAAHQDNQDFAAAPCCLCILFFSTQIFTPIRAVMAIWSAFAGKSRFFINRYKKQAEMVQTDIKSEL